MKITVDTNIYTFEEFCIEHKMEIKVQKYGKFDYIAYIDNVKFRNMRGETIRVSGISPISAVNRYINKITRNELSITTTKPHTKVIVPKLELLEVTDLTPCEFCISEGISLLPFIYSNYIMTISVTSCPHCNGYNRVPKGYTYPLSNTKEFIKQYEPLEWSKLPSYYKEDGLVRRTTTHLMNLHKVGLEPLQTISPAYVPNNQKRSLLRRILGV